MQLKRSLQQVPSFVNIVQSLGQQSEIIALAQRLDPCEEVTDLLEMSIVDNPPLSVKEGNIIQDGYNAELIPIVMQVETANRGLLSLSRKNVSEQVLNH